MIKKLITDIANDTVSLSQALTKAKIIAYQIDNKTFQEWLKNELEGYQHGDSTLPPYRQFSCELKATIGNRTGHKTTVPITFSDDEKLMEELSTARITASIPALEENYKAIDTDICTFQFPPAITKSFLPGFKKRNPFYILFSIGQEFDKFKIKSIIDLTKQKLLDTLLEFDKTLPNFDNDIKLDDKKAETLQNIVTNNIYGNNNPINVATGKYVEQKDFSFTLDNSYSQLENLGVEQNQIDELKRLVSEYKHDQPTFILKTMQWLGSVTTSVATKGLVEHIPAITDFVHKLIT